MHPIGIGLPVHCNKRRITGLASYQLFRLLKYKILTSLSIILLSSQFALHNGEKKSYLSQTIVTSHSPTISAFWIQLLNHVHIYMSMQCYKDFYYIHQDFLYNVEVLYAGIQIKVLSSSQEQDKYCQHDKWTYYYRYASSSITMRYIAIQPKGNSLYKLKLCLSLWYMENMSLKLWSQDEI